MKSQVIIVTVMLFSYVCATNYKRGYDGVGEKAVGSRHRRDASGGYGEGKNYPRKPSRTEYTVDDGQGNIHYRYEYRDEFGGVRGTYGYNNARGLYRVVEYVADARGFRANIKTNEPGAANVQTMPEKPASSLGGGSGSPSVDKVTGGVKNTACDTAEDDDYYACLQSIGSG